MKIPPFFKSALIHGVIGGVLISLFTWFTIAFRNEINNSGTPFIGNLIFVAINGAMCWYAMRHMKYHVFEGKIKYPQALYGGLFTGIIAGLTVGLFTYFFHLLNPELPAQLVTEFLENAKKDKLDKATIEEGMKHIQTSYGPMSQFFNSLISITGLCIVVSSVLAAFIRNVQTFNANDTLDSKS
jgi:hypothetical protein